MNDFDVTPIATLPDISPVTDATRFVAERAGTGTVSGAAINAYLGATYATAAALASETSARTSADATLLPKAGGTITGNLTVNGTTTFASGTMSGTLGVGGNINTTAIVSAEQFRLNSATSYEWTFSIQAGNHVQGHRGADWYDIWYSATGQRSWHGPVGYQMTLDPAGNLGTLGYMNAPQFWVVPNAFGLTLGGSGRTFVFAPGFYFDYVSANATLQWTVSNGPLWVMRASDDFCFNPQSAVGGNGAYINSSDRRMKSNVVPTTRGLAEVLQLQPVEFDRDNAATGAQHEIGFVAQDVQPIVPEAVWTAGIPLRDGTGGLDDTEPTLGLTSETLTAINVNAIKELNALIAALTERVAVLEGKPGPP